MSKEQATFWLEYSQHLSTAIRYTEALTRAAGGIELLVDPIGDAYSWRPLTVKMANGRTWEAVLIGVEGMLPYPQTASLRTISDVLNVQSYVFRVDNVVVLDQDLAKFLALVLLAIAAFLFFRYTPTGTAILAVSQDATAARVVGISVERISMTTWAIAGLLGGVAGVLLAVPPSGSVTPGSLTGLTLTVAFSAAVLGGMTSLPGAFVGGLGIGLIESFANADHSFVPGLNSLPTAQAEVAVAVVLLVVLLVRPRGLLGKEA